MFGSSQPRETGIIHRIDPTCLFSVGVATEFTKHERPRPHHIPIRDFQQHTEHRRIQPQAHRISSYAARHSNHGPSQPQFMRDRQCRVMGAGGIFQQGIGPIIRPGPLLLFTPFVKQTQTSRSIARVVWFEHPAMFAHEPVTRCARRSIQLASQVGEIGCGIEIVRLFLGHLISQGTQLGHIRLRHVLHPRHR